MKTKEQISYNMSRIRCKGSEIERLLCKELWRRNMRYRKNVKAIFGKPDIAFIGKKIAIFVDSEFWHGYEWETRKNEIKTHRDFWIPKIERNIARDKEVTQQLTNNGWLVMRFWGRDIKSNTALCADLIEAQFKER